MIVEVENSGEGIPYEIMPRIFDPLFTTKKMAQVLDCHIVKIL